MIKVPYISISKSSLWPRIRKYRGQQNKKMFILVPLVNVVDQVLHQLERAFLLRSCSDNFFNSRKRPCILYQKRCSAPCTDLINSHQYTKLVNAINFLKEKIKQSSRILYHNNFVSSKEN